VLRVPVVPLLERTRPGDRPQAELANSFHQYTNARGAFALTGGVPAGPGVLVDDVRGSGWTLTTVGARLRDAGAEAVYPLVLLSGWPTGGESHQA
jgi:ATP-dependent DNA helicase RecQ